MVVKKEPEYLFLLYFDGPGVVWGLCGQKIVPQSSIEADTLFFLYKKLFYKKASLNIGKNLRKS